MNQMIYQVDSFTRVPFAGNPAGVCLLEKPAEESWMKAVAREMNLSETAFLVPQVDGYNLRWFTPAVEVDLCGHATLASAHILWETGYLQAHQKARFHTRSGLLTACLRGDWIEMNFPTKIEEPTDPPSELIPALGVEPLYVGKNVFDYLVEVEREEQVRELKPDFGQLIKLPVRGVMVTSQATGKAKEDGFDIVSRFFAPAVGINEDPVTGSAHCCLAPYWSKKLNKTELKAYQASARGGIIGLRMEGQRVVLSGQAVTVIRGELFDR